MAGKAAAMGSPRLIVFGRGALCAAEALWAQAPELAESLWLRRVLETPIWVGHSPRLGSLLSRVSVPVSVCTYTVSHWLKPMASTLTDLGARGGVSVCALCAVSTWFLALSQHQRRVCVVCRTATGVWAVGRLRSFAILHSRIYRLEGPCNSLYDTAV